MSQYKNKQNNGKNSNGGVSGGVGCGGDDELNMRDMTVDEMLVNLKIISRISKTNKLNTQDDLLKIDDNNWLFQGLNRWYNHNSRQETMNKINHILRDVFAFIDKTLANELSFNATVNVGENGVCLLHEDNSELLQRFLINLCNAIKGLDNLKMTYQHDEAIVSQIDVMIENIKIKTDKMNKVLRIKIDD